MGQSEYELGSILVKDWYITYSDVKLTKSAQFNDSPDKISEEDEVDGHHHAVHVCVCVNLSDTEEDFFHNLGLSAAPSAAAVIMTICCYCYGDCLLGELQTKKKLLSVLPLSY